MQTGLISVDGTMKMKSSPPMCPTKPFGAQQALHHVVEDPGQQIDDPVAVVIAVAVVEFLEVIQVRVADRELLVGLEPAADLPLDLGGARQPGGGMHRHVPLGPHQHRVEPGPLLRGREQAADDLVGAGGEPGLDLLRVVIAGERGDRARWR